MMAGSHVALGAAAWMLAAPRLGLPALDPALLGLAVVGALAPDIDHPKSWVGRRLWFISRPCAAIFGHRGMTHSLLALLACLAVLLRHDVPFVVAAPLAVGYVSHLAADLLTPGGLRLAWPFKGTYALPLCRTGSPFEPLIVAVILSWSWGGLAERSTIRADWAAGGICHLAGAVLPSFCAEAASVLADGTQRLATLGGALLRAP
ncbi:metal-dependent hydrolase [Teichococcus aerofrigidensis]